MELSHSSAKDMGTVPLSSSDKGTGTCLVIDIISQRKLSYVQTSTKKSKTAIYYDMLRRIMR